eukprot:6185798-Pleurochrysis_carterae.AAC.4
MASAPPAAACAFMKRCICREIGEREEKERGEGVGVGERRGQEANDKQLKSEKKWRRASVNEEKRKHLMQ